jgi:hypothetical protein
VRFYLNDTFVASPTACADGRFAVTINEGVSRASYRVRLDEVERNSGALGARVEVSARPRGHSATCPKAAHFVARAGRRSDLFCLDEALIGVNDVSADEV